MIAGNDRIPALIHYCWFGGKEKPGKIRKFIAGWKRLLPQYRFMEWNERGFDIQTAPPYVREAYQAGKYAFVSDYVRIKALYEYGGIYLDTDIELRRPFDGLLEGREMVLGFESDRLLETAWIACVPHHPFMGEFLNSYKTRRFLREDGSFDMTVINLHFSRQAEQWGVDLTNEAYQELADGRIAVYPREYFAAFNVRFWHEEATENTYAIHHMNASWTPAKTKAYFGMIRFLQKLLGYRGYDRLKAAYDRMKRGKTGKHLL